jgi:CSLREA domain-containing protein
MGGSRRFACGWSTVLVSLALCTSANAATIDVTTTTDGFVNDAQCSLREAIQAANGDPLTIGECTPGAPGGDTIALPAGTYSLTSSTSDDTNAAGDLDIKSDVALTGAGAATTTIDADQMDRVIDILAAAAAGYVTTGPH